MTDFRTTLRTTPVLQGHSPPSTFDIPSLPHDPQTAFKQWYNEALACGILEPQAMTLSTIDSSGHPDARVLILKNVDARGWHVAIKADSPKGHQLAHNPHAALTFYWAGMARQVRVRGEAVLLSDEECARDYLERPVQSRISAVASRQSAVLENFDEVGKKVESMETVFERNPDEGVDGWRVYAVRPDSVEFWQGEVSRLHRRVRYVRVGEGEGDGGEGWRKEMLWP